MPRTFPTLVRTGKRAARTAPRLPALYRLARALAPEGFTAEQTTELAPVRARIPAAFALRLRAEVASTLGLRTRVLPLRLLSVQACGPVSLHDDRFRYPGVYFVIVVAHPGRLAIVDHRGRAVAHDAGEILLLDPNRRHALVPVGRTAAEHPYERTHSPVHDERDQFLFLCFDVKRGHVRTVLPLRLASKRFRTAGLICVN
ncbi:MAG: hypothetical protein ACREQL_04815 [Candidatus Binatia bacterium]